MKRQSGIRDPAPDSGDTCSFQSSSICGVAAFLSQLRESGKLGSRWRPCDNRTGLALGEAKGFILAGTSDPVNAR